MHRRHVVLGGGALALVAALARLARAEGPLPVVPAAAQPFDLALLKQRARALAQAPFQPPQAPLPESLDRLGYDGYRRIGFWRDRSLWHGEDLRFTAQFFHRGFLYKTPVRLNEVVDGVERPIAYNSAAFDFGGMTLGQPFPPETAFGGVRLLTQLNRPDRLDEVVSFLGASYFRALGRGQRYGKSARGLAIDTALPKGEEFPLFREFWLERPQPGADLARIYALLDSRSCAGAFMFDVVPGDTTLVTVACAVYARARIERLGIAPITSMYFFGENDRAGVDDFRPEVHDSDGLQVCTGQGEWIWRPLNNPARLRVSAFVDQNPRGFGLFQRDRDFHTFEDMEANYHLRPSLWVEPLDDFGEGAVQLVEIPSDSEIHDNIAAFWVPAKSVEAGAELEFRYRLHWFKDRQPAATNAARVVNTRVGPGGFSGSPSLPDFRKFVIDFAGGQLPNLDPDAPVEAVVSASRGEVSGTVVQLVPQSGYWRAAFDLRADPEPPVELRCFLRLSGAALTETWSYQWTL